MACEQIQKRGSFWNRRRPSPIGIVQFRKVEVSLRLKRSHSSKGRKLLNPRFVIEHNWRRWRWTARRPAHAGLLLRYIDGMFSVTVPVMCAPPRGIRGSAGRSLPSLSLMLDGLMPSSPLRTDACSLAQPSAISGFS